MKKERLLFFGELPPEAVHGIAIQNRINLEMLRNNFLIDTIQDNHVLQEHEKITIRKIFRILRSICSILKLTICYHFEFLYLPFSLSLFGGIKTLLVILSFKFTNRGRVILHIHRGDFFSRFYRSRFNRLITKIVFSYCFKILVLSEKQKVEFESHFSREFQILPNTVEKEISPRLADRGNKKFIFLSNYLLDKGILDLLYVFTKILEKTVDIKLETYGQFSDGKMEQAVKRYSCPGITVNEVISDTEKFRILSEADCLILPSWNEGQPVVILEAMSVGTPVISTYAGLIPEILGSCYPYLFIPADRKSLEKKILQFLQDNKTGELSVSAYDTYCRNYSRKTHKECLYRIFELS